MKPITREWIVKAEADLDTAVLLRRSRKPGRYDIICFHCQQCVEKYLKAHLQEADIAFPKTHDLGLLLKLCLKVEPMWAAQDQGLKLLSRFAVEYRYPGEMADRSAATDAYRICVRFRKLARAALTP
jgi:HEPN domain-containing protein